MAQNALTDDLQIALNSYKGSDADESPGLYRIVRLSVLINELCLSTGPRSWFKTHFRLVDGKQELGAPTFANGYFLTNEVEKSGPTTRPDTTPIALDVEHGPLRVSCDHPEP